MTPKGTSEKPKADAQREDDKAALDRLGAYSTVAVAVIAFFLALYTGKLWKATVDLAKEARADSQRQAHETQESLRIAQASADAARRSAEVAASAVGPFLIPEIRNCDLHPPLEGLAAGATHKPSLTLGFNNVGSSPAILQRVAAQFFLAEREELPSLGAFESLKSRDVTLAIPPNSVGGSFILHFNRSIDAGEIRRLAGEAQGAYLRFLVLGYVVYTDVFAIRHTRRFCLKVGQDKWQELKGDGKYNRITREDANKSELPPEEEPSGSRQQGLMNE